MAAVRGFFAILIGVLVAWIIGAAYDYIRPPFIPNPMDYKFAWPLFFAFAGGVSSIIAVVLFGLWSSGATGKPGTTPAQRPAGKSKTAKSSAISTSSDVPGMPTFDVDKLKAENAKKEQGQR
jgi:hypothetical protein